MRGTVLKTVATVAVLGLVGTAAVIAQGFDAQEAPPLETAVWVTRDAGQYGRVNTELGELDTVRSVGDPSAIVQHGARGYVFSQGYSQMWAIDAASPADLSSAGETDDGTAASGAVAATPPALTRSVVAAGPYVLFHTETGEAHLGGFPGADGVVRDPAPLDPFAGTQVAEGETRPRYTADAAALDADGRVALYSAAEGAVRVYEAATGRFAGGAAEVPDAPEAAPGLAMAFAGGRWVLADQADGRLWIEGRDAPVETGFENAVLQWGASDADHVLLADRTGLAVVSIADGEVDLVGGVTGTPAAPIRVGGVSYAAWVSETGAALWTSESGGSAALPVEEGRLADVDGDIRPVFRSNGDRAVLNETATGMSWTLPEGRLVPSSDWAPLEETVEDEGTVQVDDVIEQEPPVAVDDAFGVRAGALVALPLLLNDHDPNKDDVLTIDPASFEGLDPAFGTVSLVGDDQLAVVQVAAAEGSAVFRYSASDGLASSAPATVTLTVVPEGQNTAPVWCGVAECLQPWPAPQIAPGGFASVDVLSGWVDPEGDAVLLADARADDPSAPVTVVPTADGRVVVRHSDPNAGDAVVLVAVVVSDARGATTEQMLEVRVTGSPSLDVEPVVVSAGVGEERRLEIADSVSGGSGSYRLVDAVAVRGAADAFTVVPSGAAGVVELSASRPGEYAASYTVQDTETLAQQTAVIRYSVQESAGALAAPPLTAFVRAGEDATVDVLASVQNTTGRVLLVQEAVTSDPALSVSVIGQSMIRVSSIDAAAQPGRLGAARVLITDGAGSFASTTLTVFLLAATHGTGPIAMPDAVSVRAGTQIDIPVLANDVSPRGERLRLHPEVEGSGAEGELVFAGADRLRYLAPETPGTYTVRYAVHLENDPGRIDAAAVTIDVLPAGANRPPQPGILSARVLAGQSVLIPVPTTGIDPDGDATVLADVEQPAAGQGSVSIAASGDALVYRAPANGVRGGQLGFAYTVRDAEGAEGEGLVRVGVLDAETADVAPITYSDHVGAQRGSQAPITVLPLRNDRDPLQGALELVDVRPNAARGTAEWTRLESLLDPETSLEEGRVVLRAGEVSGTNSYVYTVRSTTSFSNAEGLIVIGVSDEPAPDRPVVADTIVTVQNRVELERGIDVVTGKVQWPTGDVESLELSLWRATPGFEAIGHRIAGALSRDGALVPFVLTGADAAGREVTAYGFLRVPALDDMRVQLSPAAKPVVVDEEKSVSFDVGDFVDVAPGDRIQVRDSGAFPVQREAAACRPDSGARAEYAAGREAPWRDTCSVAVRIAGQSTWSIVPVPIEIVPKEPQAILSPASRTVPPAESVEIDLLGELTSWEGGRVGDASQLDFSVQPSAPSFEVSQVGTRVVATARADARPGTRETLRVSVSSFGGLSTTVTLVVGIAAPDAPRGATFTRQCDVSAGACQFAAVGVAGEYDPFAGSTGSGLRLVDVGTGGTATCAVATVTRLDSARMVATWPGGAKPVGGECVVPFTVADAQERTGQGQVTLDVLGYPQTPASIVTTAYTPTSVTLRVALGEAARAHPAVTGVALYEGGSRVPADCVPGVGAYLCTVTGLVNGARHVYTARAVNSIGESADTSAVETWAYDSPVVTDVRAASVYRPGTTTTTQGRVELQIDASADAERLVVYADGSEVWSGSHGGGTTEVALVLPVGARTIEVVPISRYTPPISGHRNEGAKVTRSVTSVGAPYYSGAPTAVAGEDSVSITTPTLSANSSPQPLQQRWAVWTGGSAPQCTAASDGGMTFSAGGAVGFREQGSPAFTGLDSNQTYFFGVCGSNGFGVAWAQGADSVLTWRAPFAPTGDLAYTVSTTAVDVGGGAREYRFQPGSVSVDDPPFGFITRYTLNGTTWYTASEFSLALGDNPFNPQVRYCLGFSLNRCGPAANLVPDGGRNVVRVEFPMCLDESRPNLGVVVRGAEGSYTVNHAGGVFLVSFTGAHSALDDIVDVPAPPCTPPGGDDDGDGGDGGDDGEAGGP